MHKNILKIDLEIFLPAYLNFLGNCPGIDANNLWVNIGPGNGLVSSGNKLLPEPVLYPSSVMPYGITKPQWVNLRYRCTPLLTNSTSLKLSSMQCLSLKWYVDYVLVQWRWMPFCHHCLIVLVDFWYCHSTCMICSRFDLCMSELDPLKWVAINNLDITMKWKKYWQMETWASFHHDKIPSGLFPYYWPVCFKLPTRWNIGTEAQSWRA